MGIPKQDPGSKSLRARTTGWVWGCAAGLAVAGMFTACGGNPPAAETTSTPRPTDPPPSATPLPPTRTPTALPPIPTANFTPDQIVGIWHRFDIDRGDLYLTFTADGIYDAAHGTVEGSVHHGHYSLEGTLFTFLDGWNCSPGPHTAGKYVLRLVAGGRFLYLDPYQDTCPDRPFSFRGFRHERWVPTPTPTP